MDKRDMEVYKFRVLWHGWECDSYAWIMERADGTRYIKMTNHGGEYIASVEELEERITHYKDVIEETQKALRLLSEVKNG